MEQTIIKIASGAEDSEDMRSYAKKLIRKFDQDNDGVITLKELCQGLKTLNIYLNAEEREALMQKLDSNRDGDISEKELFKALSSVSIQDLRQNAKEAAEIALKKIAAGAEEYGSMREYVNALMKKFDNDGDGLITFDELSNGLKKLNINLTQKEKQALMKKLDLDADGELSSQELFSVLSKVDVKLTKS